MQMEHTTKTITFKAEFENNWSERTEKNHRPLQSEDSVPQLRLELGMRCTATFANLQVQFCNSILVSSNKVRKLGF